MDSYAIFFVASKSCQWSLSNECIECFHQVVGSWAIANGRGIVTLRPRSGEQILQVNIGQAGSSESWSELAEPELCVFRNGRIMYDCWEKVQSDAYIALDEGRQCQHAKGGERPCGVRGNALFPPNTSLSGPSVRYSLSILFFSFQKKKNSGLLNNHLSLLKWPAQTDASSQKSS